MPRILEKRKENHMKRTAFIIGMVFIAASAIAQNADLYLQIQHPGRFEVRLGDEVQISSRGRFRFFDMNGGLYVLNVYRGNFQLYSGQVQLIPNQTIIAELNQGRLFSRISRAVGVNQLREVDVSILHRVVRLC